MFFDIPTKIRKEKEKSKEEEEQAGKTITRLENKLKKMRQQHKGPADKHFCDLQKMISRLREKYNIYD
jgi:uncharacterized protein YukE